MAARIPLPDDVRNGAFRVQDARTAGISQKRLAGRDLARPYRGVRMVPEAVGPAVGSANDAREQVLRFAPRLRARQALGDVSALIVYGLPVPTRLRSETVDVIVPHSAARPRAAGVRARRIRDEMWESHLVDGVPVVPPALLFALLGRHLLHRELVTVGDAILSDFDGYPGRVLSGPLASLEELAAAVAAWRVLRGCDALRSALPRLRARVASPPESWTRCIIVDAGLPEPEVNADIFDGARLLARGDLVFRAQKVVVEYEGAGHLTPTQFRRDITRTEALIAAGWRVIRITHADLFPSPAAFLAHLRAALTR